MLTWANQKKFNSLASEKCQKKDQEAGRCDILKEGKGKEDVWASFICDSESLYI